VSAALPEGDASDLDPAVAAPATSKQVTTAPAMLRSFKLPLKLPPPLVSLLPAKEYSAAKTGWQTNC
ncbi:MAG TPA: hypothetical protein VFP31_08475, partial [Gaiellaceae bacterium]|nr:hypothetical protein [Gaiellaceae bacterium]